MHRTRPWRSTGTASVSCGQVYAAIWTRRWYQRNISRYAFTFLLVLFLINSTHCHDALGARDNPGNQAIALHRDGIKAWEPISDECVHMFNSNSNQPSGGLGKSVWNGLHFETDQLWSIAAVCVTIQKKLLNEFRSRTKLCIIPLLIIKKSSHQQFLQQLGAHCYANCRSVFALLSLGIKKAAKRSVALCKIWVRLERKDTARCLSPIIYWTEEFTPAFSVTCIAAIFRHHSTIIFRHHLSTSSFDVLFEISQSQPMHAHVSFMSLPCKWATSSKGHVSGLWLVDFDPSCLLSLSKDGWRKISAMHVTLKAGIIKPWFRNWGKGGLERGEGVDPEEFCQTRKGK